MPHETYDAIVNAVKLGKLHEPFSAEDVRSACPQIHANTPSTFLPKHALGNPGGNSVLFKRVSPGRYKLIRPLKYGRVL